MSEPVTMHDPLRRALMDFGRSLRDLRADANLTQRVLAERIHSSDSRLSDLERGVGRSVPFEHIVTPYIDACLSVWAVDEALKRGRREKLLRQYSVLAELRERIHDGIESDEGLAAGRQASVRSPEPEPLAGPELVPGEPRWVVPDFAGELTRGRDLLGIHQDASALAVLLASKSLNPPVALGLFGEWGSGKTFFMRVIEREIERLTNSGFPEFGQRVRAVWFNAWHYADANLWASLVHHIFLSLQGEDSRGPLRALDDALAKVQGVQDAKAEAVGNLAAAHEATVRARQEFVDVEARHRDATNGAAAVNAKDIWAVISVDEGLRQGLIRAVQELGLPAVGDSAREVAHAAGEVRSVLERGRVLATAGPVWKSPLVLGLLLAVVVSVSGLLLSSVVDWSNTWLAPMVAATSQLAAIGSGTAGWLARQAALMRRLLDPAERIQRQIDARVAEAEAHHRASLATAEHKLSETRAKLGLAEEQLAAAEAQEAAATAELRSLSGPRLLERYLSERISSEDYSQYLGVVALAHRDLRDLDTYLRASAPDTGGIDRIVLYIDDLDRCPPETVVRVLEAVHLLMALPLFVVVVGVDVRWLVRSLRERHPLQLESGAYTTDRQANTVPADYLDKIFQLTYQLPAMTPQSCASLLHYIAVNPSTASALPVRETVPPTEPAEPTTNPTTDHTQDHSSRSSIDTGQTAAIRVRNTAAALQLGESELDALQWMAPLVGTSPRRAKRFLNVYQICKARALADDHLRDLHGHRPTDLMLLTALMVGLPDLIAAALDVTVESPDVTVREWLRSMPTKPSHLANYLAGADTSLYLDFQLSHLMTWVPLVRRFAWPVPAQSGTSQTGSPTALPV